MMGTLIATVPYLPLIAVCLVQFYRPTRLGWFVLIVIFSAYAIAVCSEWRELSALDLLVFASIAVVPVSALFWARPGGLSGARL